MKIPKSFPLLFPGNSARARAGRVVTRQVNANGKYVFGLILLLAIAGIAKCSAEENTNLVNLKDLSKSFNINLKYASEDNFTKKKHYSRNEAFLISSAAFALASAAAELEKENLLIEIWDAYRPLSVQKELWKAFPDERFVAPPDRGSRHNRGAAVDVSLLDSNGKPLEMPTAFDDFSEKAGAFYNQIPEKAKANRAILQRVMQKYGFKILKDEWWHFEFKDSEKLPLIDIPFEKIK